LIAEKASGEVLFSGSAKEQRPGRKGEPVKAKFLGGPALDEPPPPEVPRGILRPAARPLHAVAVHDGIAVAVDEALNGDEVISADRRGHSVSF